MKKYYYKKILLGIKISKIPKGSKPQTEPHESVGILTFKHSKGSFFPAHFHKPTRRLTTHLEECFVLIKGKIKIKLFGPNNKHCKTVFLTPGQLFLTVSGGHEIEVLEDCEVFEIKNGPYKQDKVFIEKTP